MKIVCETKGRIHGMKIVLCDLGQDTWNENCFVRLRVEGMVQKIVVKSKGEGYAQKYAQKSKKREVKKTFYVETKKNVLSAGRY